MSALNIDFLVSRLSRVLLALGLLLMAGAVHAIERVTYYHNDALGSPVAATDRNGTLLWRESYAPYGERLTHEASSKDTVWYTGKQEEAAFGLNYFGARWYDPKIGRFLGVDPAGFSSDNIQSFNRYAYANNNPYAYVDPDGRAAIFLPFVVSALEALGDAAVATGGFLGGLAIWDKYLNDSNDDVGDSKDWKNSVPEPGTAESDYGCVYECDGVSEGQETESGLPYIGTADDKGKRAKTARDGRNRENSSNVGKYRKGDRTGRQNAEQNGMNSRGGKDKLDNKRNEVAAHKWSGRGIKPPE